VFLILCFCVLGPEFQTIFLLCFLCSNSEFLLVFKSPLSWNLCLSLWCAKTLCSFVRWVQIECFFKFSWPESVLSWVNHWGVAAPTTNLLFSGLKSQNFVKKVSHLELNCLLCCADIGWLHTLQIADRVSGFAQLRYPKFPVCLIHSVQLLVSGLAFLQCI